MTIRTYRERMKPEKGKKFLVMELMLDPTQEYDFLCFDEEQMEKTRKDVEFETKDMCKGPVFFVYSKN